jgi:mRNA interferase MazF
MAYKIGDVVLVPFPFTDLSDHRVRPAVVVSTESFNEVTGDVTVGLITSQRRTGPSDCGLRDWMAAGLRLPSWFRSRFITLDQRLVQFSPGRLSRDDLLAVQQRMKVALGLS